MMTMAKPRSLLWSRWAPLALTVVLATVAIDQASKWWMLSVYDLAAKGRVEVLPFLDLVFVRNIGISYSLFNQDSVLGQYLFGGLRVRREHRALGLAQPVERQLVNGRQPGTDRRRGYR